MKKRLKHKFLNDAKTIRQMAEDEADSLLDSCNMMFYSDVDKYKAMKALEDAARKRAIAIEKRIEEAKKSV